MLKDTYYHGVIIYVFTLCRGAVQPLEWNADFDAAYCFGSNQVGPTPVVHLHFYNISVRQDWQTSQHSWRPSTGVRSERLGLCIITKITWHQKSRIDATSDIGFGLQKATRTRMRACHYCHSSALLCRFLALLIALTSGDGPSQSTAVMIVAQAMQARTISP